MLITEVKRKLEAPGVKSVARGRENSEVWLSSASLQVLRNTSCEWGTHLEITDVGSWDPHGRKTEPGSTCIPHLPFPANRSINVNFKIILNELGCGGARL